MSEKKPSMGPSKDIQRMKAEISVLKKHLCLLVGLRHKELEEQIDKEERGEEWGL